MAVTAPKLAILLLAALLLLCSSASDGEEIEDETEFSYVEGSENGPENWGNLHEDWVACGAGQSQSPIDIDREQVNVVDSLGHLKSIYWPARAILKNRGHDIMVLHPIHSRP